MKVVGLAVIATVIVGIVAAYLLIQSVPDTDSFLLKSNEVKVKVQEFKLRKLIVHKDIVLRKEDFAQISDRQGYVTPNNETINQYVLDNQITTSEQAYSKAVSWLWVSDQTLHGQSENWLLPSEFIQDTPTYPTNPVPGYIVSDCEEQAYTLVSILENIGISKQNVRVVIGQVNFSGEVGGHAWVQVYENGQWFELEATSGPFWDDDDNTLVNNSGFPYSYFKNRPYPVEEYWAFFNDRYYHNPESGRSSPDLPAHWEQSIIFSINKP